MTMMMVAVMVVAGKGGRCGVSRTKVGQTF
jgi:hypothetical protein